MATPSSNPGPTSSSAVAQGPAGASKDGSIPYPINIVYTEMSEADQNLVLSIAANALKAQEKGEKNVHQKDLAQMIKTELDQQKGGTWNVVVGKSFGSFVTHETRTMMQFFVNNLAFLIWRYG